MLYKTIWLFMITVALSGCTSPPITRVNQQKLTPLQIQSMQMREYEINLKVLFSSVVSVFQDLGYTIKAADINSGVIFAESTGTTIEKWGGWGGAAQYHQTSATATIEKIGKKISIRLSFVTREEARLGVLKDVNDFQVLDPKVYENAFEKIDGAIFLRH